MSSLGPEQVQAIKDWIVHYHGGPPRCAICGQASWDTWQVSGAGVRSVGRSSTPSKVSLALICQQCGQTLLFDRQVVTRFRSSPAQPPDPHLPA
jgi:hypothetical protein